ncbi:MAG: mandelate racemase [Betaproteobacteria bacterium]|nr:mandelate racemase [Betaproteobacteria bacterium]
MANTPVVRNIIARAVTPPFKRPPTSASGAIPHASLVLIDVETDAGITGRAYVFTYTISMLKPMVETLRGLGELIKGDAVAPIDSDAKVRGRLKLLDTPGLIGIALSGIDQALWDVLAQARGVPLAVLLGGQIKPIRAYNSCGLWIQPPESAASDAEKLVAEGNFKAIKLRVGRDDFSQDVAAARAVKKRVGDGITLMCDFNQRLTVAQAIARGRALDDEGLYWIEEPTRHDDYEGYAKICAEVKTPIQTGENLLNTFELVQALQAKSLDYVMPDVQRIGGVTGWMRAAAIAQAHGVEMSSHLFPEYSAHLLAVTPTAHYLEYMDWANPILNEPIQIKDGNALIPDRPGSGVTWNEEAVKRYQAP